MPQEGSVNKLMSPGKRLFNQDFIFCVIIIKLPYNLL